MTSETRKKLAVVTGASAGVGLELARQCVDYGFDAVVSGAAGAGATASDARTGPTAAAADIARGEAVVVAVEADLSTERGVDRLVHEIEALQRPVDMLVLAAPVGAAQLAMRLLPEMIRRDSGRVIAPSTDVADAVRQRLAAAGAQHVSVATIGTR